jgi:predicted site-specific integrase-resolvase
MWIPGGRSWPMEKHDVVLDDWLSEADTAKEIGVSVRTLRKWRREGVGPPYANFGRAIKYNKRAISEHYESMQIVPVRARKQRASRGNDLGKRT